MPEQDPPVAELSEEQRHRLEAFIEEEEGALNRYKGWLALFLTAVAVGTSAFHLYAACDIIRTDWLRAIHAVLSLAIIGYMLCNGDDFTDRNINPTRMHAGYVGIGLVAIALLLHAARARSLETA